MCIRQQSDWGHVCCLSGQCPTKKAEEEGHTWGNGWRNRCVAAARYLDRYKDTNRTSSYPSVEDRMEWLQGQYPKAFDLVAEHEALTSPGSKSIWRENPHEPYGGGLETELFRAYTVSYTERLMAARGSLGPRQ